MSGKKKSKKNIEDMEGDVCEICNCVVSNIKFNENLFKSRAKCGKCGINFKVCATLEPERMTKTYLTVYCVEKDRAIGDIDHKGPKYIYYIRNYIIIYVSKTKNDKIWTIRLLNQDSNIKGTEEKEYNIEEFIQLLN